MGPEPAPDDVRLARFDLVAVLECRPAIGSPGHLEDSGCALDTFDPERLAELTSGLEVLDELRDRPQERGLLLRAEA